MHCRVYMYCSLAIMRRAMRLEAQKRKHISRFLTSFHSIRVCRSSRSSRSSRPFLLFASHSLSARGALRACFCSHIGCSKCSALRCSPVLCCVHASGAKVLPTFRTSIDRLLVGWLGVQQLSRVPPCYVEFRRLHYHCYIHTPHNAAMHEAYISMRKWDGQAIQRASQYNQSSVLSSWLQTEVASYRTPLAQRTCCTSSSETMRCERNTSPRTAVMQSTCSVSAV